MGHLSVMVRCDVGKLLQEFRKGCAVYHQYDRNNQVNPHDIDTRLAVYKALFARHGGKVVVRRTKTIARILTAAEDEVRRAKAEERA